MARPSVLILHTDQLRLDALGCYGNPATRTPHIDALAGDGIRYDRHVVANPVCMPSRASFFTGLYPSAHGVWSLGVPLNRGPDTGPTAGRRQADEAEFIPATTADVFAEAGYHTASFGKLHFTPSLGDPSYGFAESWALMEAGGLRGWNGPYYGFNHVELTLGHAEEPCRGGPYADWLETHNPELRRRVLSRNPPPPYGIAGRKDIYASPIRSEWHHSRWMADRFETYLEERTDDPAPWLAFVGFPDPHHAFTPPEDILTAFADVPIPPPADPEGRNWRHSPMAAELQRRLCISHLPSEDQAAFVRYTLAMVHTVDLAVGRIINSLKKRGLYEQTTIIFTSDHGDYLCDHGLLLKAKCGHDRLLRVPLIIKPAGQTCGRVDSTPVSNVDVLPTLAALCGIPEQPHWQGCNRIVPENVTPPTALPMAQCFWGDYTNYTVYDAHSRLTYYPHQDHIEWRDHTHNPTDIDGYDGPERTLPTDVKPLLGYLRDQLPRLLRPNKERLGAW